MGRDARRFPIPPFVRMADVGHPPPGVPAQLIGRPAAAEAGVHGTPYALKPETGKRKPKT